jgi:glycosyltransferase involved in cell wall biosynthesis
MFEPASPLVSVIIPVFNAAAFLAEAIESAVTQTLPPREVIVVDDGSTDASAEVAASFGPPVRCLIQPKAGIGAARNLGVRSATGEVLAFLDADDRWSSDKLALQVAAVASIAGPMLVFGQVVQVPAARWAATAGRPVPAGLRPMPGLFAGTLLVRRTDFERVGPFRTDRRSGEFIDWYARAIELGFQRCVLPEVLLWRRLHAENNGIRERASRDADYAVVLKAALDRRRAASG